MRLEMTRKWILKWSQGVSGSTRGNSIDGLKYLDKFQEKRPSQIIALIFVFQVARIVYSTSLMIITH